MNAMPLPVENRDGKKCFSADRAGIFRFRGRRAMRGSRLDRGENSSIGDGLQLDRLGLFQIFLDSC